MVSGNAQNKNYPAKVLLLGEYGVLLGADAFSIPYPGFSGYLDFGQKGKRETWNYLIDYIYSISHELTYKFDIDRFRNDVEQGLWFNSNIPLNYGLGSSGALTAAIFDTYKSDSLDYSTGNLHKIKSDLSRIESYYHGRSSGIDPLVSLIAKPLLIQAGKHIEIKNYIPKLFSDSIKISLIDSGQPSKTGTQVKDFYQRIKEKSVNQKVKEAYFTFSNKAIQYLKTDQPEEFFQQVAYLSKFQYEYMKELIPVQIHSLFENGIKSGNYSIKLCGSGGGGMFLCFCRNSFQLDTDIISTFKVYSIS